MTDISSSFPDHPLDGSERHRRPDPTEETENYEDLLRSLRRKEGSWVEWGQACANLQKGGYNPQAIFEATGFEPIQQNQIIVASQVYETMMKVGVSEEVRSHYWRIGSDSLYELRILTQPERAAAAEFLRARNIDSEGAKEVAKAMKDFSRLGTLPQGFSNHPGDAVAYQYWRFAKQQSNLAERSRLIARGLMFAHSQTARQQIEQLLTDFGAMSKRSAPSLPFYRLEAEEELPRIIPVAGELPLKLADWERVQSIEPVGAFQRVQLSGEQTCVSLPGWQVILKAKDPVALLCQSDRLPVQIMGKPETVLLVIDRTEKEWNENSYFLVEEAGNLQLQWFPDSPNVSLLGRLVLTLRPKRMVDEEIAKDVWQIDE